MKKRLTNLIVVILISGTALYAQSDFRKGYIVKLNGDTLWGFVNFQKDIANVNFCNFKRFEIAHPVNYPPTMLKAYGIENGKQYISISWNGNRYFAEYLVKGEESLLYLDKSGDHFFIYSKNNIVELKQGKMTNPGSGMSYSNYKEFLQDRWKSAEVEQLVRNSKFEIHSLTNLISLFNEKSSFVFEVPQRPKGKSVMKDYNLLGTNKLHIGLVGGTSLYKFTPVIYKDVFFYLTSAEFNTEVNPIGGVFARWSLFRTRPQFLLQTNILYQQVSLYAFSRTPKPSNKDMILYDDIYIDFNEVKIQALFNYSFNGTKFNLIPHAGVGYCKRISPTYQRYYEEYNTLTNVVKSFEFTNIQVYSGEGVLIGGVSLEYKLSPARSFFLNLDYEYGAKLIKVQGDSYLESIKLKGKASSVNLTLGITL